MAGLCTLTVNSWGGELPVPGQYVKSARGRTAFLIVQVKPAPPSAKYRAKFVCERERPENLRPDAIVHPWRWARR